MLRSISWFCLPVTLTIVYDEEGKPVRSTGAADRRETGLAAGF
jgi:hypothetical protein